MEMIKVRAEFKVLTVDEGGKRTTSIYSGYRPDHIFEYFPDGAIKAHMGDITLINRKEIYPGEKDVVFVRFVNSEATKKYIQVGRKWWINEANNPIGEAIILEIIET